MVALDAYGNRLPGSRQFKQSVAKLTRGDLQKFHYTWFKANNATLIIVGCFHVGLHYAPPGKLFGGWKRVTFR